MTLRFVRAAYGPPFTLRSRTALSGLSSGSVYVTVICDGDVSAAEMDGPAG